ncbi:Uncharacterised protein [Mycobacteroides abscessus subsp. abscessus]|nr:Uncharacterised protein [Mycobacteroides abscessus subsp. abscessus]
MPSAGEFVVLYHGGFKFRRNAKDVLQILMAR